jgi:hypothetical protein
MVTMDKPELKQMKKFVVREAETLKTTRASYYGACCCRVC